MDTRQRKEKRTNLLLLWGGLINLLATAVSALAIWFKPFSGPDIRVEACLFLWPCFAIGISLALWGFLDLRWQRKRGW